MSTIGTSINSFRCPISSPMIPLFSQPYIKNDTTAVHWRSITEGVTENLRQRSQWDWIGAMSSISSCAEEIVRDKLIYA